MPVIQNFSTSLTSDEDVYFTLDPGSTVNLSGASVYWDAFPQEYGVFALDSTPVISKSTVSGVTIPGSPPETFVVSLSAADKAGLSGNYYHQAVVVDVNGNTTPVTTGIMTVVPTRSV